MGVLLILAWIGLGLVVFERLTRCQSEHAPQFIILAVLVHLGVPLLIVSACNGF
jgi:hypothetical protein